MIYKSNKLPSSASEETVCASPTPRRPRRPPGRTYGVRDRKDRCVARLRSPLPPRGQAGRKHGAVGLARRLPWSRRGGKTFSPACVGGETENAGLGVSDGGFSAGWPSVVHRETFYQILAYDASKKFYPNLAYASPFARRPQGGGRFGSFRQTGTRRCPVSGHVFPPCIGYPPTPAGRSVTNGWARRKPRRVETRIRVGEPGSHAMDGAMATEPLTSRNGRTRKLRYD